MSIHLPPFSPTEYVLRLLRRYPVRTLFFYSLMSELLVLLFLFLAFLLTTEILLPGFISLRLNLTWYLAAIISATALVTFIGKARDIQPVQTRRFEKPLLALGGLWACGIIIFSLHDFSWWTISLLLIVFLIVSVWFWQAFFQRTKED